MRTRSFQDVGRGWFSLRLVAADAGSTHSVRDGQILVLARQQRQPPKRKQQQQQQQRGVGKHGLQQGASEEPPEKRARLLDYDGWVEEVG